MPLTALHPQTAPGALKLPKRWFWFQQAFPAGNRAACSAPQQEGFIDREGTYVEYDRADEEDAWLESIEGGCASSGNCP